MRQTKSCPYCAEKILLEAVKCKHCGEWLAEKVQLAPDTQADVIVEEEKATEQVISDGLNAGLAESSSAKRTGYWVVTSHTLRLAAAVFVAGLISEQLKGASKLWFQVFVPLAALSIARRTSPREVRTSAARTVLMTATAAAIVWLWFTGAAVTNHNSQLGQGAIVSSTLLLYLVPASLALLVVRRRSENVKNYVTTIVVVASAISWLLAAHAIAKSRPQAKAAALETQALDRVSRDQWAAAKSLLQDAYRLDPSSPSISYNLGLATFRLGDAIKGATLMKEGIGGLAGKTPGQMAICYYNLSGAYAVESKWADALLAAEEAVMRDSTLPEGLASKAICLAALGRRAEAADAMADLNSLGTAHARAMAKQVSASPIWQAR